MSLYLFILLVDRLFYRYLLKIEKVQTNPIKIIRLLDYCRSEEIKDHRIQNQGNKIATLFVERDSFVRLSWHISGDLVAGLKKIAYLLCSFLSSQSNTQ